MEKINIQKTFNGIPEKILLKKDDDITNMTIEFKSNNISKIKPKELYNMSVNSNLSNWSYENWIKSDK
jgi:hypothetical protein